MFVYIHIHVLSQLAVLRAEKQEQDRESLEDQRREIVEAAKQFALQQEERFSKKIENLEHKLAAKNDELQDMESAVQQLRHDLKTVQHEKVSEAILPLQGPVVQSVENTIRWIKYYPMTVSSQYVLSKEITLSSGY